MRSTWRTEEPIADDSQEVHIAAYPFGYPPFLGLGYIALHDLTAMVDCSIWNCEGFDRPGYLLEHSSLCVALLGVPGRIHCFARLEFVQPEMRRCILIGGAIGLPGCLFV